MRVIFCGTPDYAVPSLKRLLALAPCHEVVAIVSQPDKPKGRSAKPSPPPVVEAALAAGFVRERMLQPRSINSARILEKLRALNPDLLCVVAYGGLLKAEALALPRLFAINAHGSLLPKYRGASPIQAALLSGDAETGVCIMKMEAGLDTGPVMLRRAIPIQPDDDAGSLHDKLADLSAECFMEALSVIQSGAASFTPQDNALASFAPKLDKHSGRVDWTKPAEFLERFVRAMNPWPGAWTTISRLDGSQCHRVRVARAAVGVPVTSSPGTGHVSGTGNELSIAVACGAGRALLVTALQPEGKRPMSAAEFLRGAGRACAPESFWE